MIIQFKGKGLLTLFIIILVVYPGFYWVKKINLKSNDAFVFSGLFFIAAIINWFVGRYCNRYAIPVQGHLFSKIFYSAPHQFLFQPMEFWSIPLIITALWMIIRGFYSA
ncbi:hypothetical protein Zymop_1349 [Zymomonas mobilis subsp. pomaceae ATCC 29192]|uniref:Uncharacterized protein n=1 Tax=Zymomonas mobilis subsp. pomaceae (strain ATCC 29192 / DSM 22645 / JCM 10191 / CCUG 17912 / NBRC 13757 / NCIMB 11200 / NRRL B-4491 / Barker I) TaxID=579138 RepID=F8EUU3_ZYMMT|nr:hypothetical protein Zymop_1349 [Zymomonas mobilis subsp. pomaceae ATCC 29192]